MTKKAQYCQDCKHFRIVGRDDDYTYHCLFGHHPRFYRPISPVDNDFGWKRRCDEFEPRDKASKK